MYSFSLGGQLNQLRNIARKSTLQAGTSSLKELGLEAAKNQQ